MLASLIDWPAYQISSTGHVFNQQGMQLKTHLYKGYPRITLYNTKRDQHKCLYVHTLVLVTFKGKRPNGKEARHLDNNRLNCSLDNLEWATKLENEGDKKKFGTHHYSKRDECSRGHRYTEESSYLRIKKNGGTERVCRFCRNLRKLKARGVDIATV